MGSSTDGATRPSGKHQADPNSARVAWAIIALIVACAAWWVLRTPGRRKPRQEPVLEEEADETLDRLEVVREALFPKDGRATGKSRFGDAEYWDERYARMRTERFDWYGTWNSDSKVKLKQHVMPLLRSPVTSVLNVGCGNSRFAEELYKDGHSDVVSIDISQKVIDSMSERLTAVKALRFLQMDATNMSFGDGSFDIVFEKGTLDALYTSSSRLVSQVVSEVSRVLRPGGLFVSVSFGMPTSRQELNATSWEMFHSSLLKNDDSGVLYLYAMRKASI